MERKTKVDAQAGQHDLLIQREFDLPVDLLFKAYEDPDIIEQWMNTKVVQLESRKHGSYSIETRDPQGNLAFTASGVFHEFIPDEKITRTFEMEKAPFGVQLEVYEFEAIDEEKSKLTMHVIFETVDQRDQLLKLPFATGLSMAHDRIQEILKKQKNEKTR